MTSVGYAQQHGCRDAVVAGGGLLGLEAAYALPELGLAVTVLERGTRLLSKQIDEPASELVHAHFARVGIASGTGRRPRALERRRPDVSMVTLVDGTALACRLFVACVGIRPNTELAAAAGISVNRGVLVDDRMETSVPGVFAAGDVAEHDGLVLGLWPIAAKQGEVAALNALGGDAHLIAEIPATILKGVGLELSSIGRVRAGQRGRGDRDAGRQARFVPATDRLRRNCGWCVGARTSPRGPGGRDGRGEEATGS